MASMNPCCCITVRTGSFVIAILEIILNIISVGLNIFAIVTFVSIHASHDEAAMHAISEKIQLSHPEMNNKDPDAIFGMLYILFALACVINILQFLFAGLLLRGIQQERLIFLKLWLIVKVSCLVFSVLFTVSTIVLQQNRKSLSASLFDVTMILLWHYFVFVVYQLYKDMRTRSQQPCKPNSKYNNYA